MEEEEGFVGVQTSIADLVIANEANESSVVESEENFQRGVDKDRYYDIDGRAIDRSIYSFKRTRFDTINVNDNDDDDDNQATPSDPRLIRPRPRCSTPFNLDDDSGYLPKY